MQRRDCGKRGVRKITEPTELGSSLSRHIFDNEQQYVFSFSLKFLSSSRNPLRYSAHDCPSVNLQEAQFGIRIVKIIKQAYKLFYFKFLASIFRSTLL